MDWARNSGGSNERLKISPVFRLCASILALLATGCGTESNVTLLQVEPSKLSSPIERGDGRRSHRFDADIDITRFVDVSLSQCESFVFLPGGYYSRFVIRRHNVAQM